MIQLYYSGLVAHSYSALPWPSASALLYYTTFLFSRCLSTWVPR